MVLEVRNLNYQDFKDINYSFDEKKLYTIIGCNKSGKTTLFRLLSGIIPNESVTCCNTTPDLLNRNNYIKNIGVVKSFNNSSFKYKSVYKEMQYPLSNLNYFDFEIKNRIEEVLHYFALEGIMNKKISELSDLEKQLFLIANAILHKPKVLLMDSCLDLFNNEEKNQIIKILRQIINKENLTIINFTTSLEEGLVSDKIILLNNYRFIKEIDSNDVVNNDKLFYDNNIEMPFIIDLNSKLRMYNLINKDYYNLKEMVDNIWP